MTEYSKPNISKAVLPTEEPARTTKNIGKVIQGNAQTVKKGEMQKIAEAFLPKGGVLGIKEHVIFDVVIPTIKKILSDTVETILWGGVGLSPKQGPTTGINTNKTQYSNMSNRRAEESKYVNPRETRPVPAFSFEDILVKTRGQGLIVLETMKGIIDEYESVCVADLYEMVGLPESYADRSYGWLDLEDADVVALRRGGYVIRLPRPIALPASVVG